MGGGVGGCATYPANATQPATATHMLFVSLVTRIQLRRWATLRQETRHKEEWKNRQSWGVTSLPSLSKCKRQEGDRIRGSRSIFTVFQPEDWSDLLLYPDQFFEAVSLLSIWWPGATGNNFEWRGDIVPPFIILICCPWDNFANFDCNRAYQKSSYLQMENVPLEFSTDTFHTFHY